MTSLECALQCADTPELVAEFDRLTGNSLSRLGERPPIVRMIDEATGYEREQLLAFLEFVWDCIWTRPPDEVRA